MSRDTRPDSRTRFLDVPVDPVEGKRDEFFAGQLEIIASEREKRGLSLGAAIFSAGAVALRDEQPLDGSAVIRTAYAWFVAERQIPNEDEWAAELVRAASTVKAFRSITTANFLLGVAAGLRGETLAPADASSAWRMGLKAVLECERGRAGLTQLVVAADTEPDRSSTTDLENEPTRPHVAADPAPPPLLPPLEPEEDTPIRRGKAGPVREAVAEDDLTRAHLIPKTEQLPQGRKR
jgi:hypothetical protein